ncbi:hypothetical protein SAMN03159489_05971 [Pseudomonas sp. NFPP07]|uniref:hypothetical protein n=1 Tax=unclassified Pseudomonas TaxID=196821 RepID=UPI0008E305D9|nr:MULTISPECIES: hypothetical protein [unclassified Pseudomonas]PXX60689.1 hypothetical protein H160_04365 [Pseudomonas sp. LAMO17WK12:I9]SFQ82497.1 hypothetical protein SAMN03159489_05971 [Pseudomonas sp. NFPP07]SNY45570.1 hypothetical protein SAMN05660489_04385 [Pseudomonas sp. LAMO17WK12:I10]
MSQLIYTQGTATFTVPANESVAVFTVGEANVFQNVGFPNFPSAKDLLGTVVNTQTVFGPFTTAASITIEASAAEVQYEVGTAPTVLSRLASQVQAAPVALNATGAITAAAILGGIVTSTTAAAVAGTVPTGAVMDAATEMAINDSVDWSVINTGGNTFTVTAATGHTLVGVAAVVTVTSGLFRTRKTAADTFVTYRLS